MQITLTFNHYITLSDDLQEVFKKIFQIMKFYFRNSLNILNYSKTKVAVLNFKFRSFLFFVDKTI